MESMETNEMSLNDITDVIKRRKVGLILTAAAVFLISLIVCVALPSIYQSSSTILIEEQEIPADFVMTTVTSFVEQRLQTINQRIMSTPKLLEIINKFGLYTDLRDKKTTDEIVEQMREDVVLAPISTEVIDRRTGRPTNATIAFTLSYEGKNPQKVQRVANMLTSLFLEENLKERREKSQDAITFLERESDRVKGKLSQIEKEMAVFKEGNINTLPDMLQLNLQTLNNTENNMTLLKEQLRSLKEREGSLLTQLSGLEPAKEEQEKLQSRERLEELKLMLINYKTKYSDEYPDVKKTVREIAELEEKLDKMKADKKGNKPDNPSYVSISSQLASIRSEIRSVKRQSAELNKKAEDIRKRIGASPKVEEAFKAILIQRNNLQLKYDDLMSKLMEARVAQGLETEQKGERFTLIDPPRLPEKPYKPNRLAIMLIGLVLGCGAGVGFAAFREFTDNSVRTTEHLATAMSLPVLAGIPEILTAQDRAHLRTRRIILICAGVIAVVIGIILFHFFIMDLDVFWARLMRKTM